MARTKEFDVDETIDRAVDLFRSKGHAATSIQDLVDRLGLNRGSIYNTFDSKECLYELALQRYVDQGRDFLDAVLSLELPLRERLDRIVSALVESAQGRGCLVVNTACERNDTHPAARAAIAAAFDVTRQQLRRAIDEHADLLPADTSVEAAAETVLVLMQGLMVMATAGPVTASSNPSSRSPSTTCSDRRRLTGHPAIRGRGADSPLDSNTTSFRVEQLCHTSPVCNESLVRQAAPEFPRGPIGDSCGVDHVELP